MDFLDAARGIAALLVVFEHSAESDPLFHGIFFRYFNLGEIGVVAFFLISGFIIPASIERSCSLREFWMGRAFRLLPALWVNFAVVLAAGLLLGALNPVFFIHPFRYLIGNLLMIPEALHVPLGEGVYWTLQYELVFYVLTATLFAIGLLRRSAIWAWAACCLYAATNIAFVMVFHRAFSAEKCGVVVTAFVGTLIFRYAQGIERRVTVWGVLASMGLAVVVSNWLRLGMYDTLNSRNLTSPLCGDLSFLLGYSFFGAFFALRRHEFPSPLLWLGKISYSVYLWHAFVLLLVPPSIPSILRFAIVASVTFMLASVSYRFVEVPAQNLFKRFRLLKVQHPKRTHRVCAA